MKLVRWMRFTWDLKQLPPVISALPEYYQIRPMEAGEQKIVTDVVHSALSLEVSCGDVLRALQDPLQAHLANTAGREDVHTLVLCHGRRIIGASALGAPTEDENHLMTGPCVLMEYRNRSLGTALLYGSLRALKSAGLERAHGLVRDNVLTCKFVYPKFGSTSMEVESAAILGIHAPPPSPGAGPEGSTHQAGSRTSTGSSRRAAPNLQN